MKLLNESPHATPAVLSQQLKSIGAYMNMIEKLATAHTVAANQFSIADVMKVKSEANNYVIFLHVIDWRLLSYPIIP